MDNREKRPIFDLKKSNSMNRRISIKDPVTGRDVLGEILQDPAENYKEQHVRRTRSAFKEQVLARLSEESLFKSTQQIKHIQDSKEVLPLSIVDPNTGKDVLSDIQKASKINKYQKVLFDDITSCEEKVHQRASIVDPSTGNDKWTELLENENIKQNALELENKRKRNKFREQVRQSLSNSRSFEEYQSCNNCMYQDNEEENSDASYSSDWGQCEYEDQGISSVRQRYMSFNDHSYQDCEEVDTDISYSSVYAFGKSGGYVSAFSQEYATFNDYSYQDCEEVDAVTSYSSVYAFRKSGGYASAFSQEYAGATNYEPVCNPLEPSQLPWNQSYEEPAQDRTGKPFGSYQQLLALHSNQSPDSDDDFNHQDSEYITETSDYPSASDSEKHNGGNAFGVRDESKIELYEGMIDIRETGQFLENGDNCEDTKTRVMEITKENTNEINKESPAQAVAEITNTSEPVLFNHLSCIIVGWKGSGKTTVLQLLESERWDDVFEDKDIGINGNEKPNRRKKNSVSFIEVSDSPLCNVLPVFFAPATVGILVIDMTKKLTEIMNTGSDITGFSKLTYRDYIVSWLQLFQNGCTSKMNIILVGTRADGYSEKDANAFMDEILKLADNENLDMICLSKEMTFTISSQKARNKECSLNIEKLKACVPSQIISYDHLRKPVPMRWISWFEVLVVTCQHENKVISIDKLWMLNGEFPKEKRLTAMDEMKDVLGLFNDIGKILFQSQYCNVAVLDIQYIVDVVSLIMSSRIRTGEITFSVLQDMLTQSKKYWEESTKYLEAIGLASKIPSSDVWYFPTLNTKVFDMASFENFKTSSVFCFKFNCHAKLIFHMLVCMCLSINKWCVLPDGKTKCLYKNDVVFSVKSHNILIRTCDNKIQIQILWLHEIKVDSTLIYEIMKEIASLLETIKTRKHANIKFETGFKCGKEPLGKDEDTFISFEEANGSGVIQCPRCPLRKSHSIDVQSITEFWMHGEQQNKVVQKRDCGPKKLDGTRFKKACLKTTDAKVSDLKSKVSESVGMIQHQDSAIGTGFRVGENKVMTCWHVVGPYITEKTPLGCELDLERLIFFKILFQFKDRNEICQPKNCFSFIPHIHFKDEELDVIVLELERHQFSEVKFPPPIRYFCKIDFERELHLIGHPGGVQMKEDSQVCPMPRNVETCQFILKLEEWSILHCPSNGNFYSPLHDEHKVLLHTTFDRGSSGSPGINIHSGKAWVVLMLSGGVPTCFYDGTYTNIPHDKLVEYGVSISDIYLRMKPKYPTLCTEIFPF